MNINSNKISKVDMINYKTNNILAKQYFITIKVLKHFYEYRKDRNI